MMRLFLNYIITTLLLSSFVILPVKAKEPKPTATVQQQISSEEMPKGLSFVTQTDMTLSKGKITIPKNSMVYAFIVDAQDERRWHKSGFIICKLKGYTKQDVVLSGEKRYFDIEKDEIYMVARKYAPIDKKEAGKTAAELTVTTAASFVVPGIDIAYYFTKGAINKEEGKTRFKSGVSSAYENSIFWFWLKGKPIDLEENASIVFKEINKERAQKLSEQIEKRKEKSERMQERKEAVKNFMSY